MIPRKRKVCKSCRTPQYLFSGGLCRTCWGKAQLKPREPSTNTSRTLPTPLSPLRYTKGPLKGKKPLKRRSARREGEEALYKQVCIEIDKEANEKRELSCFMCGMDVWDAEHHHLLGRRGKLLYEKKYIVRVHGACHYQYHFKPVAEIDWWLGYLCRIKEMGLDLFHNIESEKKNK